MVMFDKATYEKMLKDVPQWKLITTAIMSERLKINGSLARKGIRDLVNKGLIRPVNQVGTTAAIFTRSTNA